MNDGLVARLDEDMRIRNESHGQQRTDSGKLFPLLALCGQVKIELPEANASRGRLCSVGRVNFPLCYTQETVTSIDRANISCVSDVATGIDRWLPLYNFLLNLRYGMIS